MKKGSAPRLSIALVLPRFPDPITGGAELHARWLAERLVAEGHRVEILTTTAVNHVSWAHALPEGETLIHGLVVRRFRVAERDPDLFEQLSSAIRSGRELSESEEEDWFRHHVSSPSLESALAEEEGRYDIVLAMPYLAGTTYFTSQTLPSRTVLIPCLHDEPVAYLRAVARMLGSVKGIMFNAPAEVALASMLTRELAPHTIVGVGFDPPEAAGPAGFRSRHGVEGPLLLYVGRREATKNTDLLMDHFLRYKDRRGGALVLGFAGTGDPLPDRDGILELKVDLERERDEMYRAATIFCQPSTNESLSLVLMQAWLAERPAVVHGDCAVTRDHCERSNGGLWFRSYAEFELVLDRLLADEDLQRRLGSNGRRFVERVYSWEAVLERFENAVSDWFAVP